MPRASLVWRSGLRDGGGGDARAGATPAGAGATPAGAEEQCGYGIRLTRLID